MHKLLLILSFFVIIYILVVLTSGCGSPQNQETATFVSDETVTTYESFTAVMR